MNVAPLASELFFVTSYVFDSKFPYGKFLIRSLISKLLFSLVSNRFLRSISCRSIVFVNLWITLGNHLVQISFSVVFSTKVRFTYIVERLVR